MEILGLLLHREHDIYYDFITEDIFNVFVSVIIALGSNSSKINLDIIDLVIWILTDVPLTADTHSKNQITLLSWIIQLLDFEKYKTSTDIRIRICQTVTELMQKLRSSTISTITSLIQMAISLLCHILDTDSQLSVKTAAWQTLSRILYESESNKTFIGRKIGYEKFAGIVIKSGVLFDREAFDVVLELSCYGFSQSAPRVTYSSSMDNIIRLITTPQALFTKLLDHNDSSQTYPTGDSISEDEELSSHDHGLMISLYPKPGPVKLPSFRYIKTTSLESLPIFGDPSLMDKKLFKPEQEKKAVVLSTEEISKSGKTSVSENCLTALSSYRQLAKVQIRNSEVTPLLLSCIIHLNVELQKEILTLLLAMCQSNEGNKKVLSQGSALIRLIEIIQSGCNPEVQSYYLKLFALLGSYDVTPSEVKLLFNLASQENNNKELQINMLHVLASIADRIVPPIFFSFSGLSGHFRLGMLDRFPSSKVGYTLSCWVKLNAFLYPESGLLSWNSHQNN